MDFNLLLIAGASAFSFSFVVFSWFILSNKRQETTILSDKNTSTCNCKEKYCGYCGVKQCKCSYSICMCKESSTSSKTLSSRIKNFLYRPISLKFIFLKSLHFPTTRFDFFALILRPLIDRLKLTIKSKQETKQMKAEASLHKLARSLWDQGKYAEAERINLEVLNVRRLVFGDKK